MPAPARLTHADLNRATLSRQGLLERNAATVPAMLERVVGLQAQEPKDPYVALYARIKGFRPEMLERALAGRRVVRMALMRSTIHLVTARDALALRPLTQPVILRSTLGSHGKGLKGIDADAVAVAGAEFLADGPRVFSDVGRHLRGFFPSASALDLQQLFRATVPLVQVPPRGFWSQSGAPLVAPAATWLKGTRQARMDHRGLVRRYLAAFGPASVNDAQAWSGLTKLRDAFQALRLRTYDGPEGTLHDLPRAPRPDGSQEAPARFLPVYDNAILGYRDRRRIVPEAMPGLDLRVNEAIRFVLMDGVLSATWRPVSEGRMVTLQVRPLLPLPAMAKRAIREEGDGLLECLWPEARHSVVIGAKDARR